MSWTDDFTGIQQVLQRSERNRVTPFEHSEMRISGRIIYVDKKRSLSRILARERTRYFSTCAGHLLLFLIPVDQGRGKGCSTLDRVNWCRKHHTKTERTMNSISLLYSAPNNRICKKIFFNKNHQLNKIISNINK